MDENSYQESMEIIIEGRNLLTPCHIQIFEEIPCSEWIFYGQTEESGTRVHTFMKTITFPFFFELAQRFKLVIIYEKNTTIGEAIITFGSILQSRSQKSTYEFPINIPVFSYQKNQKVMLTIRGENKGRSSDFVTFIIGSAFKNITWLIPSVYFVIWRMNGEKREIVYRGSTLKGNEIIWPQKQFSMKELCRDNKDENLIFEFFGARWIQKNLSLGEARFSVCDLLESHKKVYDIVDYSKVSQSSPSSLGFINGKLIIFSVGYQRKPSFLDYVIGGLDLNVIFAIDFTSKNLDPETSESSHYLNREDPCSFSKYESIMKSLGKVLLEYSIGKNPIGFGFGGRMQGEETLSFPLNSSLDGDELRCTSLDELLQNYRDVLEKLELAGSCQLAPVLEDIVRFIDEDMKKPNIQLNYYIVIIMLEGPIVDKNRVLEVLSYSASRLPVFFGFIGMGYSNFEYLEKFPQLGREILEIGIKKSRLKHAHTLRENLGINKIKYADRSKIDFSKRTLETKLFADLPGSIVEYFYKKQILPIITSERLGKKKQFIF